jgi:hypothetical protein
MEVWQEAQCPFQGKDVVDDHYFLETPQEARNRIWAFTSSFILRVKF